MLTLFVLEELDVFLEVDTLKEDYLLFRVHKELRPDVGEGKEEICLKLDERSTLDLLKVFGLLSLL